MEWMEARKAQRASPQGLWPEASSVIALGMSYAPDIDPLALAEDPEKARISVYAQGRDYHDVVKKALKALARWLIEREPASELKVFVDTAPVMEKPLGEAAGIGWQGKHTNLVSREPRQLAVPRRDLLDAPLRTGRTPCRPLRPMSRLPGCVPDRCLPRAIPARCPPLHFLPHHRTQGADTRAISRRARQSHLWLRRLPCRLPMEQVRRHSAPAYQAGPPRRTRSARTGAIPPVRRCGLQAVLLGFADQAHRPRPLRAQLPLRCRQ